MPVSNNALSPEWLKNSVENAVKTFWSVRNGGEGVRSGKTLDAFISIVKQVVVQNGLPDAEILTGKTTSQLPGFFRPHKAWDVVILNHGKLIGALELKSQIGSIGNNFNNRTEEVLGSSIDLNTAIEEMAFGENPYIFTGYIIVVEKSEKTIASPKINMKHFPVMEGFLHDEQERASKYTQNADGFYPTISGISYLKRYDLLCKRLMLKGLYKGAAVLAVPIENQQEGTYEDLSPETSIFTFMMLLSNHCRLAASIEQQKSSLGL